jgi:hypothetical protein
MSCAMMAVLSGRCDARAMIRIEDVVHAALSAYAAYPAWAGFSMLCTRQQSFHCVSTFCRPRSVKRSSRSFARRFPKTGSTAAKRCAYCARPDRR